jgi:type VI secretion system protein ImpH
MATAGWRTSSGVSVQPATEAELDLRKDSVAARLFREGYFFGFFQAVRLLEKLLPGRVPVGLLGPPAAEVVRFRAHQSLSFPPSQLYEVRQGGADGRPPVMTVAFFGLSGPSGVLPRHYTELIMRLQREAKGPERTALRDWLDLFNHRLLALFYRAWEKYRFYIPYERGEYQREEPDTFTRALLSLVGVGMPPLRNRLRVSHWDVDNRRERVLARVDDLSLIYYSGLLMQRPRGASALRGLLQDYFGLPVEVKQFHGVWLRLDADNQSRLGGGLGCNNQLGSNVIAGERVWDVTGKIRLRVGPLTYAQFREFAPDHTPTAARKAFFLLVHLTRLFVGPTLTFDVQLALRAADVPECRLENDEETGPRLGWDTWLTSRAPTADAEDAVFEGEEVIWVNEEQRYAALGG